LRIDEVALRLHDRRNNWCFWHGKCWIIARGASQVRLYEGRGRA
jgi:hypothetical protein